MTWRLFLLLFAWAGVGTKTCLTLVSWMFWQFMLFTLTPVVLWNSSIDFCLTAAGLFCPRLSPAQAEILSVLSHRNIIQFYGAMVEAPNYGIVIGETFPVFFFFKSASVWRRSPPIAVCFSSEWRCGFYGRVRKCQRLQEGNTLMLWLRLWARRIKHTCSTGAPDASVQTVSGFLSWPLELLFPPSHS